MEYDLPDRSPSIPETAKQGLSPMASVVMARRWENGTWLRSGLWGGSAAGTKITRDSPYWSRDSSAIRRWALWMGLKVPPKMPIFMSRHDGPFLG